MGYDLAKKITRRRRNGVLSALGQAGILITTLAGTYFKAQEWHDANVTQAANVQRQLNELRADVREIKDSLGLKIAQP